jgi:predicted RNA-binding Zn ribbon-like protein
MGYHPPVTSRPRPFDFNGNHLAVDFVNTVNARPTFTRDDLTTADDVYEWAAAAGLPTNGHAVNRRTTGSRRSSNCGRTCIAFSVRWQRVPSLTQQRWHSCPVGQRRRSMAARWETVGAGLEPRWGAGSLESIGHRLADEAVSLLRGEEITRLGACAGCGWLFIDTSRAHARRWCSMNACGVRDKMRRYHRRQADAVRQP